MHPASMLILSTYHSLHTALWKQSDYGGGAEMKLYDTATILEVFPSLEWKEKDPMDQTPVSGTIYPTPIEDLQDWYAQSPFYQ
jgi:hypothetical protein